MADGDEWTRCGGAVTSASWLAGWLAACRWTISGGSHVIGGLNGYERGVGAEGTSTDGPRARSWWCGHDSRAGGERRRTIGGLSPWAEAAKVTVGMEAIL
jgi:hypothetical protein